MVDTIGLHILRVSCDKELSAVESCGLSFLSNPEKDSSIDEQIIKDTIYLFKKYLDEKNIKIKTLTKWNRIYNLFDDKIIGILLEVSRHFDVEPEEYYKELVYNMCNYTIKEIDKILHSKERIVITTITRVTKVKYIIIKFLSAIEDGKNITYEEENV